MPKSQSPAKKPAKKKAAENLLTKEDVDGLTKRILALRDQIALQGQDLTDIKLRLREVEQVRSFHSQDMQLICDAYRKMAAAFNHTIAKLEAGSLGVTDDAIRAAKRDLMEEINSTLRQQVEAADSAPAVTVDWSVGPFDVTACARMS